MIQLSSFKFGFFLFVIFSSLGFSQSISNEQSNWFAYVGQYNVSKKWAYQMEAQFRMDSELNRNKQNVFRLGGSYKLNSKSSLAVGYGLINTLNKNYNDYFNEDRIWEQFQYNHPWKEGKNIFSNRIRLEQRFVDKLGLVNGLPEKIETNYQNRIRYLNRNTFHILDFKSGNEELYFVIQDELFFNIGENNVKNNFFDQNRFLVGAGINYKNSIRFEVAYMNQLINSISGNDVMSHVVTLTLFQNLIFY